MGFVWSGVKGNLTIYGLFGRQDNTPIYKTKKNEDYISDMVTNESRKYLLCSSGDGSLTTIDLEKRAIYMQSEDHDDELTCLGLFRTETKLLAGWKAQKP